MKTMLLSCAAVMLAATSFAEPSRPPRPDKSRPAHARQRAGNPEARKRIARVPGNMRATPLAVRSSVFGKLSDGREARLWRLVGRGGLILDVTDYGGRLVRAYAPDKHGNLADVTLGWNTPAEYEKLGFSMGTLIGRYGNRIADGKFTLDGTVYQLPVNENKGARHCNLHSGPEGWDSKIWSARPFRRGPEQCIEFTYVSPDGDMGFPGTVTAKVTYAVSPANVWRVEYEATTDKPTVLNLTHHSYWNLAGESSGDVLGQELQIFADKYTKTTAGLIPTENADVKGTGFDFTELRPIGAKADLMKADASLAAMDNWYDHNFVLRGENGTMKQAVLMRDPVSGRRLEIWTTEPCMQMYGAQNMSTELPAKTPGRTLCQFAGVALETQHYPDSPNRSDFPSTVLRPGETFRSVTEYRFGVDK